MHDLDGSGVRAYGAGTLGASAPEETAVSFAAELIAVRNGRSGRSLSLLDGPLRTAAHPDGPGTEASSGPAVNAPR
ncbi:hypothetical protein [Streptomyces sp. NPDC102462]|uniref:hypothetical protein n=1 Tax=Streptomyces sp. NPDC102462 TaxID=3366178 RepID=UPI0038053369